MELLDRTYAFYLSIFCVYTLSAVLDRSSVPFMNSLGAEIKKQIEKPLASCSYTFVRAGSGEGR